MGLLFGNRRTVSVTPFRRGENSRSREHFNPRFPSMCALLEVALYDEPTNAPSCVTAVEVMRRAGLSSGYSRRTSHNHQSELVYRNRRDCRGAHDGHRELIVYQAVGQDPAQGDRLGRIRGVLPLAAIARPPLRRRAVAGDSRRESESPMRCRRQVDSSRKLLRTPRSCATPTSGFAQ